MSNNVSNNAKYKDSLFCYLFGQEEMKPNLLKLVQAVTKKPIPEDAELTINTLHDFIYVSVKNDVSCLINDCLYSFEHQSSINPNMPFRQMLYTVRLYEGIVDGNKYGRSLIEIPTPVCVVLCNDEHMKEEVIEYHLSDAFANKEIESGCEWTTTCYNINKGHNSHLMEVCDVLKQYSEFVEITRQYRKAMGNTVAAMDLAVRECIEKGILTDVLKKHRTEVAEVLYTEYDQDECMRQNHREGFEEGKQKGKEEGKANGQALILLLADKLSKAGRLDELPEASQNPDKLKNLLKEFDLA